MRVRHHGKLARIEVEAEDMKKILVYRQEIVAELLRFGYLYIALDLIGYRIGSLNEDTPGGEVS